jgi:signal transduction histidine kinase
MHRPRTLRSRLFLWFAGAILLAILASVAAFYTTRPDSVTGVEAMARNVGSRLSTSWEDPQATRAFVDEVRDVTGFDARLMRDPRRLPPRVHAAARRGVAIVPDNPQHIFIPIVRDGELLGALEMEKFGPRPTTWPVWRFVFALALAGLLLSAMAGRVANRLATPLERLAQAADRFGGGDLTSRAAVGGAWRWVAMEVRDVGVAFNRMADRVEAMVRGQRELLGAISHELRSPLGRARVALEIARDRLPASGPPAGAERPATAALDDVEKQLGAIDGILGDLLDVTRAGLAELHKETRPFVPWLRSRLAEEPAPPATILEADASLDGLALPFDGPLLARAVHNLVRNASVHGHPDGRPTEVRVSREGQAVRVVVRDHGPGFAEGLAERAFEPFVRGDAARVRPATSATSATSPAAQGAGAGSGLGLTIVRRVVEAHGGRVFARNAYNAHDGTGRGAEVGFDLPAEAPGR